jgi:hypothetical protein
MFRQVLGLGCLTIAVAGLAVASQPTQLPSDSQVAPQTHSPQTISEPSQTANLPLLGETGQSNVIAGMLCLFLLNVLAVIMLDATAEETRDA